MAGVKYEGLSPRTRLLRWSLFLGIVAVVVAGTGGTAVGTVSRWLGEEYERLPWYVTRITALLSYLALTGSVIYGLLLSTKILDRIAHRAVSYTLHQDLASIGLALALVHVAVLTVDRSVPFEPLELIVPFTGPYRPLWVAFGQIALGLTLVVLLSFYVRRRIGQSAWRQLHYLSFLAFLAATAHGLMAGSDTQQSWVFLGYLAMSAIVVFLLTYRIVLSVAARSGSGSEDERQPRARSGEGAVASSR
jgi:predicted ferric reductase